MKQKNIVQRGQALVVLLVFMVIAITLTSAAVGVIIANSQAASRVEQGETVYAAAESGAENALLRLLRDPLYTGVESLTIGQTSATVTVTGTSPKIIVSQAVAGDFKRTIQVIAEFSNTILSVQSWQETF